MAQNLHGMCRLCANSSESNLKNILTEEFVNMTNTILKYFGITISRDDIFPKEICENCLVKIKAFDAYVEQCLRVQKFFIKLSEGDPDPIKRNNELFCTVKDEVPIEILSNDTSDVKNEDVSVKIEVEDYDDDNVSNSMYDEGFDDPISELLPKKSRKKKIKSLKKKKKYKAKVKDESEDEAKLLKKTDANLKKYFSFTCFVCKDDFSNWFRLKSHVTQVHNQLPKIQCTCGCIVKSKTAIYRHVQGHNDPSSFACDKCSRITKTQEALDRHKLRHIPKPDRVYSCSDCPKVFNSKENLKSHVRVHIPLFQRYNYPCTICGNKFTTKSAVVGHTRAVHEKIKRYICDICGYACSTGGELIQHRAIHSEEKLFQCNRCPKKFKTGSNLKAHLDTHDETSYPCGMCDKVLNSRRTYRKHLLVHDDLCRHVCSFCNKAFKRRQTLKVHLTCHTGDTPVQCPWCPQKFAYSSACRTHKQRCHPEEFIMQQNNSINNINNPRDVQNRTPPPLLCYEISYANRSKDSLDINEQTKEELKLGQTENCLQ